MKNFKRRNFILAILLLSFFTACRKPEPVSFAGYKNVRFSNEGFVTGIIRMDVAFYNPNSFPMKIKETTLQLLIDGHPLGEIIQDSVSQMPAKDTFLMPVSLKVNLVNLVQKVLSTSQQDSILLQAKGSCKIGKAGVFRKLPLKYQSKEVLKMF
jgi:LEA14-like dessication related protein